MPRLMHPASGLVVHCGDSLAARYQSQGWVDADADTQPTEAAPEKPQPVKRGRQKQS